MRDFRIIIEILKEQLSDGRRKKVYDKDVASLLHISPSRFATIKKRNSMPFVAILEYCQREDICCNEIFFE